MDVIAAVVNLILVFFVVVVLLVFVVEHVIRFEGVFGIVFFFFFWLCRSLTVESSVLCDRSFGRL